MRKREYAASRATYWLPDAMLEKLRKMASKSERSQTDVLAHLIERANEEATIRRMIGKEK